MAIQEWQKRNEKKRADAKAKLLELGIARPAEDLTLKYILAEEQGWCCPYTGNHISINGSGTLFPGFDIEHTLPRSRSGDDSLANKTLCDIAFNRETKKDRMPSELANHDEIMTRLSPWLDKIEELKALKKKQARIAKDFPKENPEARSRARQKFLVTKLELKYWEDKYHRFTKKPEDITPSFINRQLIDTGIMTRHAVALLKTVYSDVYPVNGQAVAFARKLWKVQGEDEIKDRSDHTHHAKDAIVIAALSRDRFQKICTELKADDERKNPKANVAPPFAGFAQAVYDATASIPVKHVTRHNELKQTRYKTPRRLSGLTKGADNKPITRKPASGSTVRGQLHKETFYGKIRKPGETQSVCVIRKELTSVNFPQASALDKIIDPAVRKAIQNEITRRGGDFKKAIDSAVAEGTFRLPGERGAHIKKVRVEATAVKNPQIVRQHTATPSKHAYKNTYWVESAGYSNFRLAVYEHSTSLPEKNETEFIAENLLKAVQDNVRPPKIGGTFIGYVFPGTMAILRGTEKGGKPLLYKVVAFGNMENERRITLRLHTEARRSVDLGKDLGEAGKNKAGESCIDRQIPHPLLRLQIGFAWSSFFFEGIHFKMGLTGVTTFTSQESGD
jgi:CRISPR-associated endonuclease Csn1